MLKYVTFQDMKLYSSKCSSDSFSATLPSYKSKVQIIIRESYLTQHVHLQRRIDSVLKPTGLNNFFCEATGEIWSSCLTLPLTITAKAQGSDPIQHWSSVTRSFLFHFQPREWKMKTKLFLSR